MLEKGFILQSDKSPLDFLRDIGNLEEPEGDIFHSADRLFINTHIHLPPNFSAFDSVSQAIGLAKDQGIKILGAGNYYNFNVYNDFSALARQNNIFPLFSTEIIALEKDLQQQGLRVNDPGNPGRYYICGKSITKFEDLSDKAKELLDFIINSDTKRIEIMAEKMAKVFSDHNVDTGLDRQTIIERVVKRHNCPKETVTLQERHLAQAFQEVFFDKVAAEKRIEKLTEIFGTQLNSEPDNTPGIQNEIRSNLMKAGKPCYVEEIFVNLAQAKELILALGGIPCYPVIIDGAKPMCEYELTPDELIKNLKTANFSMVEFIPIRNTSAVMSEYVKAIHEEGIAIVPGTEHNTLDMLPLEPACKNAEPIPQDLIEIFREGTMVLAAHQYLCANGECGFVDENGDLNPNHQNLHQIGKAVLKKFFNGDSN